MEERIKELDKRVKLLEENKGDVKTIVEVLNIKLDNIVKSLDKLSMQYDKNVLELNNKYDNLENKYEKLKEELNEKTVGKEANNWEKIITAIITSIVGIVLGILIGKK